MVDWLIDRTSEANDLKTAQGKRTIVDEVLKIVRQLKDPVEQEHYVQKLSTLTNTSVATIQSKLRTNQSGGQRLKRIKPQAQESTNAKEQRVREQHLLAICMKHQDIGKLLAQIPTDVFSAEAQKTASYIAEHPGVSPTDDEYGTMLGLLYEEYYQHTDEAELSYQAKRLVSRLITTYAKMKKSALIQEMDSASETDQQTLLMAVKQLDDLVTQFSA